MAEISVIIPSNHDHRDLLKIVQAICKQTVKPFEIVIVDSSGDSSLLLTEIKNLCKVSNIELIYEQRSSALPGHARNIGFSKSNTELIAFIDVQTIPRPLWLETYLHLLAIHDGDGVWGATSFIAQTTYEGLVRDGFHGLLPRKTLPGSIFKREVFDKVGQFIDWVRAGEDTDWVLRLELLKVPMVYSSTTMIDYIGLIGLDGKKMLKKWYRNYSASRNLPHFFPQILLLWLVLYPMLTLVAFNWNFLIAEWRMDSPLYIGHVTKIVAILPCFIYLIVRGLVLPLRRGVSIWNLLPVRFIAITVICLVADSVKVLVFSFRKRKDIFSKSSLN